MKLQLFLAAPPTPLSFFPSLQDSKISGQGYSTDHPRVLSLVFANAVPTIFPPSSILVNNSTTLGSNVPILISDLEYISNDDILAKNNEQDFIQSKNKKERTME